MDLCYTNFVLFMSEPSNEELGSKISNVGGKELSPFGMNRYVINRPNMGKKEIIDSSSEASRAITTWGEPLIPANHLIELFKADSPTRIIFLDQTSKVVTEIVFPNKKTIRVNLGESEEADSAVAVHLSERAMVSLNYDSDGIRKCILQAEPPPDLFENMEEIRDYVEALPELINLIRTGDADDNKTVKSIESEFFDEIIQKDYDGDLNHLLVL